MWKVNFESRPSFNETLIVSDVGVKLALLIVFIQIVVGAERKNKKKAEVPMRPFCILLDFFLPRCNCSDSWRRRQPFAIFFGFFFLGGC